MSATAAIVLFLVALPFALWAAWTDLAQMKITNRMNVALILCFLPVGLLLLPIEEFGLRLAYGFGVLVIGFVLNAIGLVGGGDAKFAAALMPFIAPGHLVASTPEMPGFLLIFAVMLLAAYVTHRIFRAIGPVRRLGADWKSWSTGRVFPMGLALSGALMFHLGWGVKVSLGG